MDGIRQHLEEFHAHLLENGYSLAASKNYRFRASTILKRHPEALEAGEAEARTTVESYVRNLPRNTASTIPAAAVRRRWSFRFRKPYRDRITPSQAMAGEAIEAELAEFAGYLEAHGNIKAETISNRVASVKLFLCTTFPDGEFERRAITPKDVVDYHTATATAEGPSVRALQSSDLRSYIRFPRWNGVDDVPLDAVSLSGPNRRDHTVPGRLSEEGYEALLASCDTGTECGARDVAIGAAHGRRARRHPRPVPEHGRPADKVVPGADGDLPCRGPGGHRGPPRHSRAEAHGCHQHGERGGRREDGRRRALPRARRHDDGVRVNVKDFFLGGDCGGELGPEIIL